MSTKARTCGEQPEKKYIEASLDKLSGWVWSSDIMQAVADSTTNDTCGMIETQTDMYIYVWSIR